MINSDYSNMVIATAPWSYRGGRAENSVNAGVFSFNSGDNNGNASVVHSFRLTYNYKRKMFL